MSEQLKPCPFCGGRADTTQVWETLNTPWPAGTWTVGCCEERGLCWASAHHFNMCYPTRERAIEMWNRRANE